jgi:hypothetical protein
MPPETPDPGAIATAPPVDPQTAVDQAAAVGQEAIEAGQGAAVATTDLDAMTMPVRTNPEIAAQ